METTKEFTRFEMAVIKRTAQNTKSLRTKRDKILDKMTKLDEELKSINAQIEMFETPIKEITGGRTSEEILNGVECTTTEGIYNPGEVKEDEVNTTDLTEPSNNNIFTE